MSESFPPLETRTLDIRSDGAISKHPALSKRWAPPPSSKWVPFYLPPPTAPSPTISQWCELMEILASDLRWLLSLPHHAFWSSLRHSPTLKDTLLRPFLLHAPRLYDPTFASYSSHPLIWPVYSSLHSLFFRVFLRLSTHRETKEDWISPSYWAKSLLREGDLLPLTSLQGLVTLYYVPATKPLLSKMVANVVAQDPGILNDLQAQLPLLRDKAAALVGQMESILSGPSWDEGQLQDILSFTQDAFFSLLRFCEVHPPAAGVLLKYPGFLESLSSGYEENTRRWGRVLSRLPHLSPSVAASRTVILRLYRFVLLTPTLDAVTSSNDKRLDDFFELFANSIDDKIFVHDYEKNFPFRADMQGLLARGIFVDETRIDYMANAISACFHSCGEEYSVEKIVVDPLYDSNFDRQLLGACSLELGGVELSSLVSQVKDLLPEMPDSYIEAVLKHYGYKTEDTINALLEGSVPSRLEKYKSETYIRSQTVTPTHSATKRTGPPPPGLPGPVALPQETFIPRKGAGASPLREEKLDDATKSTIIRLIHESREAEKVSSLRPPPGDDRDEAQRRLDAYLDSSLLPPPFATELDYDDEYDDTYDDVGGGIGEPDAPPQVFKPLNIRKNEGGGPNPGRDQVEEEEEEEEEPRRRGGGTIPFCEDPALVRERFERRRAETWARKHGHPPPQQQSQSQSSGNRDVVGKAKGQGQEKDVVYNRRQKTVNKGAGGNFKKRSDFKRKEF